MPTSHLNQLNEILELLKRTNPRSVLDVGVGFGKYGLLAREYLDIRSERFDKKDWQARIDGIEAFEDYLTPIHEYIYDEVFVGNALEVLPKLAIKYDLIFLIDVLEHFELEDGMRVLDACQERGRNTIISTPRTVHRQGSILGNVYETHRCQWKERDFDRFPGRFFVRNKRSIICYFGQDAASVCRKARVRKVRRPLRWLGKMLAGLPGFSPRETESRKIPRGAPN